MPIVFLILVPLAAALLLALVRDERFRSVVVIAAAVALMFAAGYLATTGLFSPTQFFKVNAEAINYILLVMDLICCGYIVYRGVRHKHSLSVFLAGVQAALLVLFELVVAQDVHTISDIYVDQLSLIMALIIAFIGGGICIYALGYMRDAQSHQKRHVLSHIHGGDPARVAEAAVLGTDRRHLFFAIMFVFLAAMFMIIFSNNLGWLLAGWELTTVCSFILIGYTRTDEATANSFKAVSINLAGGLAFCTALILLASGENPILELDKLIVAGAGGSVVLPIALLAFAGLTKAAQMPFQSWLLGAMVAPTPVSALLHSSTMVKAGVFLLIKLAPTFGWGINGVFVVLVGALTFLYCSAVAISQSNAKRVLAYSTVANLGLIACLAGVGTPEAVWAAIFILIFHAAAKALLFCCVGTAEHRLHSRDIEDMDNLFVRMPRLAMLMALGMIAMFIIPFGMLVSKWAALVSVVDSGHFELLIVLGFGSAMTFVFWAKWLGKVLAIASNQSSLEQSIHKSERFGLGFLAVLLVVTSALLPLISAYVVVPYLSGITQLLPSGYTGVWADVSPQLSMDNLLIMAIVLIALVAVLAIRLPRLAKQGNDSVYLSGVGQDSDERSFTNAFSQTSLASQRNWYMEQIFGEKVLEFRSNLLASVVLGAFLVLALIVEANVL
ncbi:MAG: hypothetical protein LBC35_03995 [Coriobacteriales bacterium]|nr:hypothetical protein [Coriobacteriales bacterium]